MLLMAHGICIICVVLSLFNHSLISAAGSPIQTLAPTAQTPLTAPLDNQHAAQKLYNYLTCCIANRMEQSLLSIKILDWILPHASLAYSYEI